MKAPFLRLSAALLIAALPACSAMQGRGGGAQAGIDVTRQHLSQPIARGPIAIEPFDRADANLPEFPTYAAAVARQLSRLGWTVVNAVGQSEQVALIDVQQGSPATFRPGMGLRGAAGLGSTSPDVIATVLDVRIRRRSDGTVFWEGRATSEARANSPEAQRTAAVERLAEALFRDFPGESGRTIRTR